MKPERVVAIDLFAGPGGLAEGFAAAHPAPFDVALSIEMDQAAHRTLELRAFVREFAGEKPREYYQYVRGDLNRDELFERYPSQARAAQLRAWRATLGQDDHVKVRDRIEQALDGAPRWVLLGGPPCQAYSLAGRSRMRPVLGDAFGRDRRHFLYKEYLRILADHSPPVFIFENVKGLLSSTSVDGHTFYAIHRDLQAPAMPFGNGYQPSPKEGPEYELFTLTDPGVSNSNGEKAGRDFVVRSECYGIPQTRHRVIILGVLKDWLRQRPGLVPERLRRAPDTWTVRQAIGDLPALRSGLSQGDDNFNRWLSKLQGSRQGRRFEWTKELPGDGSISKQIQAMLVSIREPDHARGGRFLPWETAPGFALEWIKDPSLGGVLNHEARAHMPKDLLRYLFAAMFAVVHGRSPRLTEFPASLLPNHRNVTAWSGDFPDRFKVQVSDRPASTITAHISKDGHYFIHYDPSQCRALTVREAARLQTFPDNYYFEGNRTEQYVQVGNAVPPLLASQIADIVFKILDWPVGI